jgi:hypothetical protein
VTYFKVLSGHRQDRLWKTTKNFSDDSNSTDIRTEYLPETMISLPLHELLGEKCNVLITGCVISANHADKFSRL